MEQITVTTERGVETTTTMKNGDVLIEIAQIPNDDTGIPQATAFYINNELVDRHVFQQRLKQV
ncbi:hypothetical protein [Sphingobacterium griseoflavum]|uniref:Uncharacterized protein n=1 Tax=Sphingobacterium griseoflavum TaxID=1474952 RepID=A0ABQ3HTF1_9SPHI|nr:hypothetical protein [Sphingobacterium griseoflavum]GHE33042.1 hypothetical protein GCM10017764_15110 [Sphingobacterium griseoflavum]